MSNTEGRDYDWSAIERLPEFQQLTHGRCRFAWTAGGIGIGFGAAYVVLAATAHDLMGTRVAGSFTLGFAGGVALVVMTWAITWAYLRRSTVVWGPLEARVRERVLELAAAGAPSAEPEPEPRLGHRVPPTVPTTQEV